VELRSKKCGPTPLSQKEFNPFEQLAPIGPRRVRESTGAATLIARPGRDCRLSIAITLPRARNFRVVDACAVPDGMPIARSPNQIRLVAGPESTKREGYLKGSDVTIQGGGNPSPPTACSEAFSPIRNTKVGGARSACGIGGSGSPCGHSILHSRTCKISTPNSTRGGPGAAWRLAVRTVGVEPAQSVEICPDGQHEFRCLLRYIHSENLNDQRGPGCAYWMEERTLRK